MITSANNSQVKNVIQLNQKAKARRQQGLFTAEGRKMFREAPADWISRVYVAESLSEDEEILGKIKEESLDHEVVADPVFRQMSDTQTPQGVLTVLKKPVYTEEVFFRGEKPFLMVLEDLQDPGNVGTIFRTGEGAGITGVLLTKTCVDVTNPKVIRSTMGSIYRMPFLYIEDVVSWKEKLKEKSVRTLSLIHI